MTTTAVGVAQIIWEFESKGDPLPRNDLFMGLIGLLIWAARSSTQNFESFVGSFLSDYKAVSFFASTRQPSIFSKAILVNTLVATAKQLRQQTTFSEMSIVVRDTQGVVVSGGVMDPPMPPVLGAIPVIGN